MTVRTTKGCSILVVEDHPASAEVMAKLLRICGHDAVTATSAKAAVERAAERRFDLLVCDVGLPDGDGCDVFRAVNAMYPVKGIAVTGYGMDEHLAQCVSAGFAAHLVKPVAFEKVKAVLEELCRPVDEAA